MLLLLLAIAIPANLVGIVAVVYGVVGRGRGPATAIAIFALLAAAMTTSLTVFEVLTVGKQREVALLDADPERARRIERTSVADSELVALVGAAASVLPWLGAVACFVRARKADD